MSLNDVTAGLNVPSEFHVIVEIPMHADPIKYEVDKQSGAIAVDRFMSTAMHYPCNYGYIPRTLSKDGDPVDVLVIAPLALIPGVVVRCRPLGLLRMTDEAGDDAKVLAAPIEKCLPMYAHLRTPDDLHLDQRRQIEHFFLHYKDLEPGKWVTINGWGGPDEACAEILEGAAAYERTVAA